MSFLNILTKKKLNFSLTKEECYEIINAVIKEEVQNYQISALLMAIWFNGLNENEMIWLTEAICDTSEKINPIAKNKLNLIIDKHSSGGIGDKVTLIISPILAAIGFDVVKLSGRGLGHTGGTIDKLESIGIFYEYNSNDFQKLLDETKIMIMLQNKALVPADKKLYALRDTTSTIDSFPLIAISIMCKKLVIKSDYIFLDIKIGSGAFCKTYEDGQRLANLIQIIAKHFNRSVKIHLTDMNQPIGHSIGNAIEIKESLDFLQNKSNSQQLHDIIYKFCLDILIETNICNDEKIAKNMIDEVIKNGLAYQYMINFIEKMNGNIKDVINDTYFHPKYSLEIKAKQSGKLSFNNVEQLGEISRYLGSGRISKDDLIDYQAGIQLNFDPYTYVEKDQLIAVLYSDSKIDKKLIDQFNELLIYEK
ncbi:MAG: thymidine phosphorylase [Ureaplasma sp.]|nr:thymidine phosphorylase [Ureaplasma sp.]